MSLKDLFNENKNLKSFEPISKEDFKDETESFDYADAVQQRDARFVATEGFDDPSAFARFGSAEKYYEDSIKRIYNTYPYDGSLKEKVLWEVSSSLIDLYIFENGYPRTNGYANFTVTPDTTGGDSGYFPSSGDDEYILVKGGPHAGSGGILYYDYAINNVVYRKDANIYDLSENRENNLLIDGEKGNTVEFWLKKDAFVNQKETIFDVAVTGALSSSADYARLTVGLDTASVNGPFEITYQSGTAGLKVANIGSSLTTANIADSNWHHYAVRMKNTGSNILVDLFVDGQHNERIQTGTTINYVSGALVGTVGALVDTPSGSFTTTPERGWAKLSGSLDEFRYWKTFRTSKKIQRYWFDQVGGGTNTDTSNTHLGVYYKFNEGITGDSSIDSVALDYSGRISNGTWTGYASTSRSTNSAIIEASASTIEFKDPIIYSSHPDISTYLSNMQGSGSVYDDTNPNSMISFMPAWIIEQNETDNDLKDKNYLWNLLQIVSSYFDEAAILLDKLPQLSHKKYYSGVANPPPFNKKALESCGFIVPEIFINSNILEKFEDRDDEIKFASTLQEVKNTIYQNIYNNLDFIYKSKGTEKSFRNLFHCFGFGDDTLKFNIYANNAEYKLEDNLKFTSKIKNYINFNKIEYSDASVYQYKIDSDATSYISGTSATDGTYEGAGLAFTLESNVILPNRVTEAEYRTVKHQYEGKVANVYPLIVDSSLFGIHTANGTENDLTWDTDDYANFEVTTVKDDKYSSNAYFKLTGTAGGFVPELTSSLFEDVYDDQLWTVSVTVEPTTYPFTNQVSGTDDSTYTVRFYGVNYIADYKAQEFLVTGTMTNDQGRKFLSSHKRTYVGAHRTNFTGSVLKSADTKINSCKAWMTSIPTGTIDRHNLKIGNYGPQSSTQNAFLYQDSINGLNVPEIQTLALLWDFSSVTGSNTNGQFVVEDETSGSATDNRFGWFSDVVSRRHTASGSFFDASATNVVQSLDRGTYQAQVPEVLLDSNLTRILSEDDEFFNRNTRPIKYHMSIEKNLFQDISEEMLNMFGSVVWFNKMIGEPVNVYRGEYKELIKAADLFFEKVGNDYDFDKYVEYFKFIDYAMSRYVMKLVPASLSTFKDGISTIIENFALGDRSKYQSKYPIIKDTTQLIAGEFLGINELLYDWKHGHAPISDEQKDNCLWWKERAERSNTVISSGDTSIDSDRQQQLDSIINETNYWNGTVDTLAKSSSAGIETYEGSAYVTRRLAKPYKIRGINQPDIHGGGNQYQNKKIGFWDAIRQRPTPSGLSEGAIITIEPPGSSLGSFKDCDDNLELSNLKGKRKYTFSVQTSIDSNEYSIDDKFKGDLIFPFSLYSSSLNNNPSRGVVDDFQANLDITNLHHDSYGPFNDVPMQGPFTEKYVGGRAYRHVFTNFSARKESLDTEGERLEGWILSASADSLSLKNPNSPKSVYFRDGTAKRPVNIANIQQLTGAKDTDDQYIHPLNATIIGNYSKGYEIVLTNARSINNKYLVESDGAIPTGSADSSYISGAVEFALPRRDLTGSNSYIIVNRFSAPGDPATMAEGMLDIEAGEYSVYNSLPWRNLSVRLPMNELLSDHSKQFGYFSDAFNSASYDLADVAYPGSSGSVTSANYDGNPPSASFHKVNRNRRKQIQYSNEFVGNKGTIATASVYDNAYVTHPIPRSDMQYAWITGNTENVIYGYEQKDLSLGDYASSDIQFVSASDFGGYSAAGSPYRYGLTKVSADALGWGQTPVDFVNLNTFVLENVTQSYGLQSLFDDGNNVLGSVDINYVSINGDAYNSLLLDYFYVAGGVSSPYVTYLNSLLLHREGPYGGANWKLYRKDNHPIVRYQKNNNVIGYVSTLVSAAKPYVINFVEPPVTSKYKPLIYSAPSSVKDGVIKTLASHGNIRSHFTDHTKETDFTLPDGQVGVSTNNYWMKHLDVALPTGKSAHDIKKVTYSPYVSVKKYLEENKDMTKIQVVYTETIYPKGLHTYLSPNRKRLNFANNFWRDNRTNRSNLDLVNAMNDSIQTASIWKLDAHLNFLTGAAVASHIPYSGGMPTKDGTGELQNCYSLFHYAGSAGGGARSDIIPAVNYNRRIKLIHRDYTEFNPARPTVPWSELFATREDLLVGGKFPLFSNLAVSSNPARFSASVGDTFWEATSSIGAKPFYDSYDEYAEEGFRKLKDGTILPEFRISEKIDNYVSAGTSISYANYNPKHFFNKENIGDNLKIETGLLSLTGSSVTDSNTDVNFFLQRYTFSDFHKYFKLVKEDYNVLSGLTTTGIPIARVPTHKLVCNAILKFLPYDGFYPSERCVQLGELFSSSVEGVPGFPGHELTGDDGNFRTIMQPYFAPGILFNSIKSGIAVDYPIFNDADSFTSTGSLVWGTCISGNFDERLNIDNLLTPSIGSWSIVDAEKDLDLALDSTGTIKTISSKHTFAVSNFLAETMNTFVGANNYSSITSGPFDKSETIEVGKTGEYTMDIILRNSTNIVSEAGFATAKDQMYGYQVGFPSVTSSMQVNTSSVTMYNRAITGYNIDPFLYGSSFGPPVHSGEISAYDSVAATYVTASGNPHGTSFDPYTPSYYNGYSKVTLSINLVEDTPYELEQIITNLTYSYDRLRTFSYALPAGSQVNAAAAARETTAYRHAMQLSASLFLGDEKANNIIYERSFSTAETGAGDEKEGTIQMVSFKPRWECPILDFSGTNPTLSFVSGNVAEGMWHQYGEIPNERGVSLELQHNSGYDLAADVLDINKNQQTHIGKLNDASTFSEAIVAIPFKYNRSLNITEFYNVNDDAVKHTIDNLYWNEKDKLDPLAPVRTYEEIQKNSPVAYADESLYNLIQMMRKYVIPPHLDWAHNRDWMTNNMASVKPFTMFMIEYGINLDQKDIQNIWQNIEPTFARKALYVKSESNLHLLPVDINNANTPYFNQDPFVEDDTRWAIFKVKKRAKTNYNAVVGKAVPAGPETREFERKDLKTRTGEFLYSYNWPYDFFSLIELAKIDSITTFNPIYDNDKDTP